MHLSRRAGCITKVLGPPSQCLVHTLWFSCLISSLPLRVYPLPISCTPSERMHRGVQVRAIYPPPWCIIYLAHNTRGMICETGTFELDLGSHAFSAIHNIEGPGFSGSRAF
ncbi:hypothetical protein F5050DRAFT_1128428 [Lentinula boryana]|uniref:Secreted protein n=1 Tax=Lentinula boryana TaxID=40481 RepID=A0ABQ8QJZ4_9AGAR|nr:hypothetical protein F5050DRAFT_1128428 [Lentinula boryana]